MRKHAVFAAHIYALKSEKGSRVNSINSRPITGNGSASAAVQPVTASFQVFGTGLDNSGHTLADGAADAHYQITSGPSTAAPVVLPQTGFPFPYWTVDGASKWITPGDALAAAGNGYQEPAGDYTYETTFDLTGFDSTTAALHGQIGADNTVTQVLLNGNDTGYTPTNIGNNFGSLNSLDVTTGFVSGLNHLDFVVHNDPGDSYNPTGFRADLSGTAQTTGPSFGVLSTGVDDNGNVLADGAADTHYKLVSAPAPDTIGAPQVTDQGAYPFPSWTADGANSKWISPNANENDFAPGGFTDPVGSYTYETTFDLTGYDFSTAHISGLVSADNTLENVLLNGHDVGYTADLSGTDYTAMHPLDIHTSFLSGVNTLDFIVYNAVIDPNNLVDNAHNPSAFRAELSASASASGSDPSSGSSSNYGADIQTWATASTDPIVVATFHAASEGATAADFSASIDWGDGQISDGTVEASGDAFVVKGSHIYNEVGSNTIAVTITASGTATLDASGAQAITLNGAATVNPLTIGNIAVAGTEFSGGLAKFDEDPSQVASITIAWGDGQTSTGTIVANDGGGFTINGAHNYEHESTPTVTVDVTLADGRVTEASGSVGVDGLAAFGQAGNLLENTVASASANAVASLLVGSVLSGKKSSDGTPNATTAMADVVQGNPGKYYLVLFSSGPPTAPDSFGAAVYGHSWLALIDTNTQTLTARGLYPVNSVNPSNPSSPGIIRDDSKTKYTAARGYEIPKEWYNWMLKELDAQQKNPPTYLMGGNNCTTWAVKEASKCGTMGNLFVSSNINTYALTDTTSFEAGAPINTYDPSDLAVFLNTGVPGTRAFHTP